MALVITITVQSHETGVSTDISSDGRCNKYEADYAKDIFNAVKEALKRSPDYVSFGEDVCDVSEIH